MTAGCLAGCAGGTGDYWVRLAQEAMGGALVAPTGGAVAALAFPRHSHIGRRVSVALAWVAAASAVAAVIAVGWHGPAVLAVGRWGKGPVFGLVADRLTVTLLVTVLGIGAVVQGFAFRYLRDDDKSRVFFAGAGVMLSSMGLVAVSAPAAGVVVGWVAAGAAFVVIVAYRPDLPGVMVTARRTRRAFAVGDTALVAAVVVVSVRVGNVGLAGRAGSPGDSGLSGVAVHLGGWRVMVATLVVIAVLTRCALGPLGGWLPRTVAAPTPVSALLHAGFVNGGAILLVRLGPLSSDSMFAMGAAFAVAAISAVGASAVMSRRADIKTELAFSTMSQMGFMVAECTVGASAAAVVHLVGHALYKATLFLGSGGGVARPGQVRLGADQGVSVARAALATATAAAAAAAVAVASGVVGLGALGHRGADVLLVFVAASVGLASWSGWTSRPVQAAGWVATLLTASAVYGLIAAGLAAWVRPALPALGAGVLDPWLLLSVAAGGVGLTLLGRTARVGLWLAVVLIDAGSPGYGSNPQYTSETIRVEARSLGLMDPTAPGAVVVGSAM